MIRSPYRDDGHHQENFSLSTFFILHNNARTKMHLLQSCISGFTKMPFVTMFLSLKDDVGYKRSGFLALVTANILNCYLTNVCTRINKFLHLPFSGVLITTNNLNWGWTTREKTIRSKSFL